MIIGSNPDVDLPNQNRVGAPSLTGPNVVDDRFATALNLYMKSSIEGLQGAERAANLGVEGSLSESDVVQSVLTAQRALQSLIGIRDRIVSSLQEITRMSI